MARDQLALSLNLGIFRTDNHKSIHGPKNMGVAWDIIQSLTEVQSRSKFTVMMKGTHQSETLDIKKDLL